MSKATQTAIIVAALNLPITVGVVLGLYLTRSPWCLFGLVALLFTRAAIKIE